MSTPKIPLTVIGGYLGAGKTTLVNRILTGDHGRRIAVIVNDFGDVAIDEALLEPATGGLRALANGCVCCAAVDGLASALADVAALDPAPEHVIIEVSGVGDPWAVAQWGRTPRYELDGVVVVVDPLAIERWVVDPYVGDTVRAQLGAADLLLVSHADDEPEASERVAEWLINMAPAPVIIGSDVSLSLLLGRPTLGIASERPHADHVTVSFTPATTDRDVLQAWLDAAPDGVVRVKGFVPDGDDLFAGQRFGHRSEVRRASVAVDPVMVVVCAGSTMPPEVGPWCARLESGQVGDGV